MISLVYQYVVGQSDAEYYHISYADLNGREDAVYLPRKLQTNNPVLLFLNRLHFRNCFREKFHPPFRSVWNPLYFKNPFDKNAKICFVIFAWCFYYDNFGLTDYLRKTYPNCKIVCFCQDIAKSLKCEVNPDILKDRADLVISFDQADCEAYGWTYYPLVYSKPDVEDDPSLPESDVFFVGKAKNRLDDILAAYERLRGAGLRCDFHITEVPEDKQKYADDIHYTSGMTYRENLKHIRKTKCILEIMQKDGHGYTLRCCEAVAFGRKLMTNNPEVLTAPFYNSDFISVFDDCAKLDAGFVQNGPRDVDFGYIDKLSPVHLLAFLDEKLSEL